jgi:hypothetical protein
MNESKDDLEIEENDGEKGEKYAFKILHYKVYVDKYQYVVRDARTERIGKDGVLRVGMPYGYFKTITSFLSDIRDQEIRNSTIKSGSLEGAINKIIKTDEDFKKLVEPLKKLE